MEIYEYLCMQNVRSVTEKRREVSINFIKFHWLIIKVSESLFVYHQYDLV